MTTTRHIAQGAAVALTLTATLFASQINAANPAAKRSEVVNGPLAAATPRTLHLTQTHVDGTRWKGSYRWPVKPFNRQHPLRGLLNDPRIGKKGGQAFHFGIDVVAPDGTAVYAVEAGIVYFDSPRAIAVVAPDRSHSFGYWHIVPVVKSHQLVKRHQLLGHIDKGWGHVHFAERRGSEYVNPLRPDGLGPYTDTTAPTVADISVVATDRGRAALVANVYDMPSPRVPGPWADEPVTAALIRWRVLQGGKPVGGWHTAVDSHRMYDRALFGRIYTPQTRQNHEGEPGLYSYFLGRDWKRPAGSYRVQVEAFDSVGNAAKAWIDLDSGEAQL